MRKFIASSNVFLVALWLFLTTVVARMPGQDLAPEGLHGMMILFVLPAFAIAV